MDQSLQAVPAVQGLLVVLISTGREVPLDRVVQYLQDYPEVRYSLFPYGLVGLVVQEVQYLQDHLEVPGYPIPFDLVGLVVQEVQQLQDYLEALGYLVPFGLVVLVVQEVPIIHQDCHEYLYSYQNYQHHDFSFLWSLYIQMVQFGLPLW